MHGMSVKVCAAAERKVGRPVAVYACIALLLVWALSHAVPASRHAASPALLAHRLPSLSPTLTVTFLSADLHDGPRVDLPSMLNAAGHKFVLAGFKMNKTNYPAVFANPLTEQVRRLAPLLQRHSHMNAYLAQSDAASLHKFYEHDDQVRSVDAFVCAFPSSFCEAWMPFNKTIVWWPVHRYAMGRCSSLEKWTALNDNMRQSLARGDVVAAGSVYDAEYVRYFTGIEAQLLPTSALWYTGGVVYNPTRPEILVGPMQRKSFERLDAMNAAGRYTYAPVKALYRRFTLQDIASHRAVVLMPYAVVSYGITELYAMGVPLLVPDIDFLMELGTMTDTKMTDPFYCGPNITVPNPHADNRHPYSPESSDRLAVKYWLQFADFYQWPHITTFSSWEDLNAKLDGLDFLRVHELMTARNEVTKAILESGWEDIARLTRVRARPQL